MGILAWLLVGHIAGDFLLQNRWMAGNKSTKLLPLLVHTSVYTAAVALFAFLGGGINVLGYPVLFVAHLVLDRRGFVLWWSKMITKSDDTPWLLMMIDQSWHAVVLALVCLL
ncbi:MAG: DUF3307 domain-containing protein [Bacillota bacterium]